MPSAYILGIESSCDETAAAVVRSGQQLISNVVASQIATHQPFGGVVPELASREHLKAIVPVVRQALAEANQTYDSIDAIAVTQGPGLAGALLVGITYAKALAYALDKPLLAVNHLEGHIHAVLLEERQKGNHELQFPLLALVVSGGHTHLYLAAQKDEGWSYENIGKTRDDAAGEAFDKVAKLLGLGYPGGPVIEKEVRGADPGSVRFPRALMDNEELDFSFSGLKTAVLRRVEESFGVSRRSDIPGSFHPIIEEGTVEVRSQVRSIAAAFQDAVIEVLVVKGFRAAQKYRSEKLIVCGGVAA